MQPTALACHWTNEHDMTAWQYFRSRHEAHWPAKRAGCTIRMCDAQVLFDPFEEQFHLPAARALMSVDRSNHCRLLRPCLKLRGVLRQGILDVGNAARNDFARSSNSSGSQREPQTNDPPPEGFSSNEPTDFVASQSKPMRGILPRRACQCGSAPPSSSLLENSVPRNFQTGP